MTGQPRIDSYEFGRLEFDGQTYTSDVIILPTAVKSNWWREEGHRLKPDDLRGVLEVAPQVLVVGQGAHGMMKVPQETSACLRKAGIEMVSAPTARAVEIYHDRCRGGDVVSAALHLTC